MSAVYITAGLIVVGYVLGAITGAAVLGSVKTHIASEISNLKVELLSKLPKL